MLKIIATIGIATAVAGAFIVLSGFAPEVGISKPRPAVKGDRLDIHPLGAVCSQHRWPRYEVNCMYGHAPRDDEARAVLVVSADRLPADMRAARLWSVD